MDFDRAVAVGLLGLFCLGFFVIGLVLLIIFIVSGHFLPEGLITLFAILGLLTFFVFSRRIR